LYFYRLVKGNGRADGISAASESADARDKIVVIDDPVSGMDSSALFIVSSIVREMTKVCLNKTEHGKNGFDESNIKQIFILTHNADFYTPFSASAKTQQLVKRKITAPYERLTLLCGTS